MCTLFLTNFSYFLCYLIFGDNMKNKIKVLLITISIGFILGSIIYNEYKRNLDDSNYNAYLIQIGSFKDDLEVNPNNYLVLEEDGVFNVYAGITTKLSNATKIKDLYEKENVSSIIKPIVINNVEFMNNLEQYDLLLSEVDNKDNLLSINDVIISEYEELILGK